MPSVNQKPNKPATVVNTTDNTATTGATFTTKSNKAYLVIARVVAQKTTDSNLVACYDLRAALKNKGGTLTLIQSVVDTFGSTTGEDAGAVAWSASIDASSGDIRIRVTGANSTDITWSIWVDVYEGGQWYANYGEIG